MTIKQLNDGVKVNWMQVTIIEKVTTTKYIVADGTGLAMMEIPDEFSKYVEVGKGVKLVKPKKCGEDRIACDKRFSPMKSQSIKVGALDQDKLASLRNLPSVNDQIMEGTNFKTITEDYENNSIISKIPVYVTTVSRLIESKYGNYRICNLRDRASESMAINLYSPHVDKLEANQVYVIRKVKKITMKTDGTVRLATLKHSQIGNGSKEENNQFQNVRIAEKSVEGFCIMFSNMSTYIACPLHLTKLDQNMTCAGCEKSIPEDKAIIDFHCLLQVEDPNDETIKSILVFRRLLNIQLKTSTETEVNEVMEEEVVGKMLKVDYNTQNEEDDVAVKVTVLK